MKVTGSDQIRIPTRITVVIATKIRPSLGFAYIFNH